MNTNPDVVHCQTDGEYQRKYCEECGTRLSESNRYVVAIKHINHKINKEAFFRFQICNRCIVKMKTGKVPNLSKKAEDAFLADLESAGGVQ